MATERVADDVIHQELRAIGENSAADGQVLSKYLDISKDPLPPSAEEFSQTSPEERAERHERFENRSSGHVQQGSSAQSHNPENEPPSCETSSKVQESEMEKSEMLRRRIAGKRTVEEDAHVPAKKDRIECTDLSLACPLPEASRVDIDCSSASPGEKRNLEVDEEMQQKKQCISDRDESLLSLRPPLPDDQDEILWCELLDRGENVIEEWNGEMMVTKM